MMRCHPMPFGAAVLEDGSIRFRLWAPGAREALLCLEHADRADSIPMGAAGAGWYELATRLARPGSRYRFEVNGLRVPDPASRFNPDDVHGPSEVVDPCAFSWRDEGWRGRPWHEAVIYELHVGTFSPEGTFAGVRRKLGYLQRLGITAIELMPVADFAGRRGWGYDGVLAYAPHGCYGRAEDLKELVQEAHARGLMVFLDVIYNHFGPDGNYLHIYAPQFFTDRHGTPWGEAINFDGAASRVVRDFFIHNALYWLEEFHMDGLRLDAVHAIRDDSRPDIITELAQAVRAGPGRERPIHLMLENVNNEARYLTRDDAGAPVLHTAQWNDDIHHALHVLLTGESDGYYADYADDPIQHLGRALAEGFSYQGEPSPFRRMSLRGEPSGHLPPGAFVCALQTHDQIGNRAFGERLPRLTTPIALRAAVAILLLAPSPPLLFMGEEFAAAQPFLYFCDFGPELAASVRNGRLRDYGRFKGFDDPDVRDRIPDPNDPDAFAASRLDWGAAETPPHSNWLTFYRSLLALRRDCIVPRLRAIGGGSAAWQRLGERAFAVRWRMGDASLLHLIANLGQTDCSGVSRPAGDVVYLSDNLSAESLASGFLPPWSVAWLIR